MSNEQAAAQIAKNVGIYLAGGSGAPQARDQIIAIMAAKLGISKDDATKRFDQWVSQFNKTKSNVVQGAKQTAGQATDVLSQASIWAFVALLLGAIFSGIGGVWGIQPRISVVETERIAS